MPPFVDPNGSDCKVLIVQDSKTRAIDNVNILITSPSGPIVVSPMSFGEVGIHYLKVKLWDYTSDVSGYTEDYWTINVTNTAPYFNVALLPIVSVKMNEVK